jgi:spermidine synthase
MTRRTSTLVAYFVFGAYAVIAQATLLREAQILLFGSELSWGLVLAFWLAGVGIGAAVAGRLADRSARPWRLLLAASLGMPGALVLIINFLRVARLFAGVGPGEYVGPGAMIWITLVATVPVSVWVGVTFPVASVMLARADDQAAAKARAVGWAYLIEAAGSLLGGALFSFFFVDRVGAITLAVLAGGVLVLAVRILGAEAPRPRSILAVYPVAIILGFALLTFCAVYLDSATVHLRWRTFAPHLQFVASRDTRYQNAALGRLKDQYSLYLNGMVSATWPNHADAAVAAHLAACEAPSPRRILALGGGEDGILAELLCHKPERLDFVTLDEKMLALVRQHLDPPDAQALADLGTAVHFTDARRFVKQAAARGDRYDLVYLAAPEPASTLEARLYTEEFFAQLADAMTDDGVLTFTLSGSVGYWSPEAAAYVGSVVFALERVFPDVLLTFGYPTHCFAAKRRGVLVDTGEALAQRYLSRGVQSPYFSPLWFMGASDLLDAEKRASVARALAAHPPAFLNTDDRPAAALYHMRFWLQTSEASHATQSAPATQRLYLPGFLMRLRMEHVMLAVAAATVLAALAGLARGRRGLGRTALLWSVGTTGFASMALEIVLLYTFQILYGYVYGMVGLVVGVFMFGLVLGSLGMNWRIGRASRDPARRPGLRTAVALDLAITVFAAGLVLVLALLRASTAEWPVEIVTFALVAISGILGGLIFPLAAAIRLEEDGSTGRVAGAVAAADYVGACLGALATGTLLVPILGVSGACLAVAAVKVLSSLVAGVATILPPPSLPSAASA